MRTILLIILSCLIFSCATKVGILTQCPDHPVVVTNRDVAERQWWGVKLVCW